MNIKDLIKNNIVNFSHYKQGNIFYNIIANHLDGQGYTFPVPITDVGEATFKDEERAILLMRYIRKAIQDGTFVKSDL